MKFKFEKRTKISKLIALWIVFAMLITPFIQTADRGKGAKADGESPAYTKEVVFNPVQHSEGAPPASYFDVEDGANIGDKLIGCNIYNSKNVYVIASQQKVKIKVAKGTDEIIGYDAGSQGVNASYKYYYCEYTTTPAEKIYTDISADPNYKEITEGGSFEAETNKKYAIYAIIDNYGAVAEDFSHNSITYAGSYYYRIGTSEITGLDFDTIIAGVSLEHGSDKWSDGTTVKTITDTTVVGFDGYESVVYTSAAFMLCYGFVENTKTPADVDVTDPSAFPMTIDPTDSTKKGIWDGYIVAVDDTTGDIIASKKLGTASIVDTNMKTITVPTNWASTDPMNVDNDIQTLTLTSTTYKKVASAKVTYKDQNSAPREYVNSIFTPAEASNDYGYYENTYTIVLPETDSNIKITDLKLELYDDSNILIKSASLASFLYDKTYPKIESWDSNNTITADDTAWKKGTSSNFKFIISSGSASIESNIAEIKYTISGSTADVTDQTYTAVGATSQEVAITIPSTTATTGTKLTLNIKDEAGNTFTNYYYFKLDGTAPTFTSLDINGADAGSEKYAKAADSVGVTASDSESDIDKIEYYVNDNLTNTVSKSDSVTLADVMKDTSDVALVDGTYTLKAIVYDVAGNYTEKSTTVHYDNVAPTYEVVLGVATEVGLGDWAAISDSEISEGTYFINTAETGKYYAYKLVVTETNLDTVVANSIDTLNTESVVTTPTTENYSTNTYYFKVTAPDVAKAPSIIIKDKAGNKSSDVAVAFPTKVQAINQNIVQTVVIKLNGEVLPSDQYTNLVNGTNKNYVAEINLASPKQFSDINAYYGASETSLVALTATNAEGTWSTTKHVYEKTFTVVLLPDSSTDITALYNNINVEAKTTEWASAADDADHTKYLKFTLADVLFDRTNPTDTLTATTNGTEVTWVKEANFTTVINSGSATENESELSIVKYGITGTDNTVTDQTIAFTGKVTNTMAQVNIPESNSVNGTKVTFIAQDVAGNYLNGSAAGKTYTFYVDKHDPAVQQLKASKNQTDELFKNDPIITADIFDNLTIDKVEITTIGTDTKVTTVSYNVNMNGTETKSLEKNLSTLVADADKNGSKVKDGSYTVKVKAYDKAGNSKEEQISFTVDNTAPVVNAVVAPSTVSSYQSPKNASYYNGNVTINLSYTENNMKTVTVKDNGTEVNPSWNGVNGTYTITSEGKHTITVSAKDKAGLTSTEKSVTVIIDKTKPTVSASVNGTENPARLIELMSVANVKANIDDASPADLYVQTTYVKPYEDPVVSPYQAASDSSLSFSDEGEYTVSFYAIDKANNKSETRTVTFRIDRTAPVVSISGTSNGISSNGQTVTFSVDEAFWKDAKATVKVYKKPGDGLRESLIDTIEITPTAKVTTRSSSFTESGEYRFEIEASDSIGHKASQEGTLKIDVDKPTLTVSGVERYDIVDEPVTFFAEMNDNFYSSKVIKFVGNRQDIDGNDNKVDVTINNPKSSPSTINEEFSEDGIYDITLTVTDEAGNSVSSELHFTIDKTAPEIESLDWLNGKVFKTFEWDKDLDEMVKDLTVCETHMYLNGSEYDGSSDLADGSYTLLITAVDEVGHETKTKDVSFTIDSTAPTFIVTGVEEGDDKEETYNITVSLQLDEDTLDEVTLNGDAITITDNQATITVSSKGSYKLYMKAHDEAGNESEQTISFSYGKERKPLALIIGVSAAVLLAGAVIFIVLKRKKR